MNNPYLDATFIYQSMTKSATFKVQERQGKSRSRLPRALINRLRSKDASKSESTPTEGEKGMKIKFRMEKGEKEEKTTPPASPLIGTRKKESRKKDKKESKKENTSKKKEEEAKAKGDKNEAKQKAKERKRKKRNESECESDSSSSSSESEDESESDSSEERDYAKGKLRIRKQRSISMNSLLQEFFNKMDQQAQEPALSLVVTPPSSRSPTIGAGPAPELDRTYSLTESGSGESNVLMLTRSQAAMKRARDVMGHQGMSLVATEEVSDAADNESDQSKQSSDSGSFSAITPITTRGRKPLEVGMVRSDDGVFTVGTKKLVTRRSEGLLKKTKTKSKSKAKRKESDKEKNEEASGHYVGTGVELDDDDDDDKDDDKTTNNSDSESLSWSDDNKAKAEERSTVSSSETEEVEETNVYGGFAADSSDSDSDSDGRDRDSDSSTDDEASDNAIGAASTVEEVLATFSKQYLHILEDGKQLAKSDEEEELKEVLQMRTLQQLQELSLQLIKSTQPQLTAPHSPLPMKATRSAPTVMSATKSPPPREKRRKRPNTGYGKCVDWNGTFQDILWVNEGDDRSLIDRYHALKDLAHDFNHAARTYATIIIEEAFLPDHQKTIPPKSSLGGQAGGQKYVHAGILFKFATDGAGIYGGDEYAMKAAGHELKGLINFYKVHHFGICVPLMTIIDYRGFRLVAQALLPIGDDTLVYGSADAGATVRNDSREIEKALSSACYELNLGKHSVYPKHGAPVAMFGPGDMEGHFGLDGRYYLIDFARVFPPETPEAGTKGAFLYRLLRPELVARNTVALSSDSFSRFGGPTMDLREPHDTNTKHATDVLVDELVPQFAQWLDKQYDRAFPDFVHRSSSSFTEFLLPGSSTIASPGSDDTIGSPASSTEDSLDTSGSFFSIMDSDRLPGLGDVDDWASPIIQEMHRMGINVRYLGLARSRCTHEVAKTVLLSEMVCRVVKNLLRERLRERMRALRTMAEEPYKEVILELFNLLLGEPEAAAARWWTYDIKTEISKRFKHAFTAEELEPTYDLRRSSMVPYPALFVRLQLQTAVRLTPEAINDLKNGELTSLVSADIRGQGVNGKDMNIVSTAEAIALAIRCLDGATSAREADRLLRLAIRKFEKAIGRMPGDMELINYYANFLFRKVSTFVHHGMGASTGSRRTTRGRRRKSRTASDEFATWAEDKWEGEGDDVDVDEENYWEESRRIAAGNTSPTNASSANAAGVNATTTNVNANAFVGIAPSPPLDGSANNKLNLHLSGSSNLILPGCASAGSGIGIGGGTNVVAVDIDVDTSTTNVAAAKWAESLRWHIALLSKMLKLFKTCENFVMLNILADLCKQFATNLQRMDDDLKRTYALKFKRFAAKKNAMHAAHSLSSSAPGGHSNSAVNSLLGSGVTPSGRGGSKSPLAASLPGTLLTSPTGHLTYERSFRRSEALLERERDRRRDLLHSYQLQALYLTNECYTAITIIESSAPMLDFVQATISDRRLMSLRSQKTASAPSLRPSSMPMTLTATSSLPALAPRPASTGGSPHGSGGSGNGDDYHIMKEKRSSIGMHIIPHRSASFIGKKMMPFVYFRWAELLYLRAQILEKKTQLEKRIRNVEVAEGLRSEEEERRWDKEKREEIEYLRYTSGKRYRTAFQLLDNTESRNIVQRADANANANDDCKTALESSANGRSLSGGEKKDARRWVITAYPTGTVKENISLATVMELYRCNLDKHGRWGALAAGRRNEEVDSNNQAKERRGGGEKKEDDGGGMTNNDGEDDGQQQQQEEEKEKSKKKNKKEKKEKKESKDGGTDGKKKKKKKGEGKKAASSSTTTNKSAEEGPAEESDKARRRREREEAEKALFMQEMKKAKEVARNKNKIQRMDDEEDENAGDARKLRIVVDEDVLKEDAGVVDNKKSASAPSPPSGDGSEAKSEKGDGKSEKAKTKGVSHGSGTAATTNKASSTENSSKDKERGSRARSPKDRKAPSISAQLRSQKLKTFDDEWLPAECISDDLFLAVVKNCPVQEVILGADAARGGQKDGLAFLSTSSNKDSTSSSSSSSSSSASSSSSSSSSSLLGSAKKKRSSPSTENLLERKDRRERRSVQLGYHVADDGEIGRHSNRGSGGGGEGSGVTPFASPRRVLTSPFASSSSATLPPPGSFATRSFSSTLSTTRGGGGGGGGGGAGNAAAPHSPAISVDALQKAAASGSFNELTHLTLKRYEELTDAQLESIVRIQFTTLTSLRLEGCAQLSDKTLQHLSSSLFGANLRHLSFKNCPRLTNRGVLDLVKTTTSLVSLCLDNCEKISNKPIIYMAKGCPSLRHLSLMGCKKISDKSIVEISTHATNLASLRVSSDRVTDASLVLMGKNLPQLYSLTMANCNITNEGLQAVCWGVAAAQLTHLCFVDCEKVGGKEQLLFNVVHKCPNLLYLYVKKPSAPVGKK